ncbi:T9SS type A sorting domain-containing protein [Dyadobacter sandarakinus]|uniref:T9SS type A sorting domain-containing protein n=1 Tax=Dyadobacter sandarakinus TaxID=2747268 RepID=A0ABX7ICR5_9BACT|nr:T9SS type A sorting domain-containing protein [Dyadobacter sandarakinus]QRR03911.1 T9SS type A sorting domain-containing protein [Dyadobacter sandarakinus]
MKRAALFQNALRAIRYFRKNPQTYPISYVPAAYGPSYRRFRSVLLVIGILVSLRLSAQQTSLACNDDMEWTSATFPGLTATSSISPSGAATTNSSINGTTNLTDADLSNSAVITLTANKTGLCTIANTAQATLTVNQGNNAYNLGNYVGFITSTDLSAFTSVRIVALTADGTEVSATSSPIISNVGGGRYQVGFVTSGTGTFTQIRLVLSLNTPLLDCSMSQTVAVYNAFQVKYCPVSTYNCNTATRLDLFNSSLTTTSSGGNLVQLLVTGGVVDEVSTLTPGTTDYTRVVQLLTSLGEKWFQVRDNVKTYPAGTYAGFEISRESLLGLDLLGSITIQARLNGVVVDSESGAGLLLGGDLLAASSRNTVGFTSDAQFNEIRIVFAGTNVGVGETRIYNAVFQNFCEGSTLACNTPTRITSTAYPLALSVINSGLSGAACVGCSIQNQSNAIDADLTNAATLNVTGTVGAIGSLSVRKELASYPAGTFAGFDISNTGLLGLDLLSSISIRTYENGILREAKLGGSGLVNVGLVQGDRQTVGFLATQPFDEVQISVQQLVGVALGPTLVYGPVIQSFCNDAVLECNVPANLTVPANSVFVNAEHTGVDALVCGACTISNTQAVVDGTLSSDFATLVLGASVGSNGEFAVKNAITNYPAGYYAGFDIQTASLLNVNALGGLRIRLYLDGVETPASVSPGYTGTGLLVGASLLSGSNRQIVGVVSENPFDEVHIEFANTIAANLGTIQIYNTVIQPLCNLNPITCGTIRTLVSPNQPVVVESSRTGLQGAVCALCAVQNAGNVVTADPTDFARIAVAAGVLNTGSVSVKNGIVDYLGGSTVGFAIRDLQNLIQADLFGSITLSTYLNGALQQQASGSSLLNLQVVIPIINAGAGVYYVSFTPTLPFDEVRLTLGSLASVLNQIQVYSAFVKPFAPGCSTPVLAFNPIPNRAYIASVYNGQSPISVASYSGTGAVYSAVAGTDYNRLPPGLTMNPATGVITGVPTGPAGTYTFMVEVRDADNQLIGQRLYNIGIESALPVRLVSFTATQEGPATLASWSTSEEIRSDYFDLERSENGKVWTRVGSKSAGGTSKTVRNYSLSDLRPLSGNNYYRLKMVDTDGSYAYSHIEHVYFDASEQAPLYPNPITRSENLRLNISDWSNVSMVRIVSTTGKEVFSARQVPADGIRTQDLTAGIYLVQVIRKEGAISTYKFVKQ